jgi:hypothetical protein
MRIVVADTTASGTETDEELTLAEADAVSFVRLVPLAGG